jgi:hypothetical protein
MMPAGRINQAGGHVFGDILFRLSMIHHPGALHFNLLLKTKCLTPWLLPSYMLG